MNPADNAPRRSTMQDLRGMKRRGWWEPTVVTEISERVSFDRQESHVVVTYQQDIPQNHEVWEMVKSAFITILIVYTHHSIYQSRPNR